uniref:Uncharacterized protein n=1 Tax=Myoviridae sp. ctbEa13 TaxID=2825136 RepID=A0A8S5VBF6_9CAUD|nr:MAG TPA: hypothetical protein [Myoviridae sp. ctbEa13]
MIYSDCKVGQLVTLKRGDNFGKLNSMDSETWTILSECGVYKIIRLSNAVDGRVKISAIADPAKTFFVRPTSIELFRLDLNNVDDDCVYDSSGKDEKREERDVQDEPNVRDETGKVDAQKLANEMKACVDKMEETRARWRKEREERESKKAEKLNNDKVNVKITYTINLPENHKSIEEIANFIVAQACEYLVDGNCVNMRVTLSKDYEEE